MCLELEFGAVSAFLLTLHTAAELLLFGIERLSLLEQVKTRQCEVVISAVVVDGLTLCWSWRSSGR